MATDTNEPTVGEIIWSQISRDTKWACGARDAVALDDRLHFTVTITPGQRHKIEVTLDRAMDLYNVKL